ncbi:MAG: hypothetical protein KAI40_03275 [Desulfobacterales bacterium]|nr:hypothetical protein [Desulfobacterales bacterium]
MAKYKSDKFYVMNIEKVNAKLTEMYDDPMTGQSRINHEVRNLIKNFDKACIAIEVAYKKATGKKLNQKYYVCNQDEPYAQNVIDIILTGESEKKLTLTK